MGRKRPNNRRRRAHAARLEAAARLGVGNFNPGDHSPTEDAGVLEVPLELSPILTPGESVSYRRTAKPSPAPPAVVPESPATPSRGNRSPLRVHRPRRDPAEYDHVPETPRSRCPQTRSWESPRLRLKSLRHTHARAPTSKRCLAKDPRIHLFPEARPAGLRHLAPHEPPDRPVRVLVRLHEERRFIIGYFLDSHPSDQRDCDAPGSSQTPLQSHKF